ncbi:hypothetical protein Hdeb2414_s0023g00636181 [Helianthus debilis subsp. tardiflorus]
MTNCRLEELFRTGSCARAKGTFLISVASVEGNVLMGSSDLNVRLSLKRELWQVELEPTTSFRWCLGVRWRLR